MREMSFFQSPRYSFLLLWLFGASISGCNSSVEPEKLYGEWKYVKVESPAEDPPLVPEEELERANPSIIFTKNKDLTIMWGGEKLSYGKFRMDGQMIRYTENLPGGQTREFPYLIKSISDKELVFQTMSRNFTRVTAIRR